MKILCTGDWHANAFKDFSKSLSVVWDDKILRYKEIDEDFEDLTEVKELNSRLLNILGGICDMRDYCLQNKITDVLFGGDMFHKRANIDVVVFNSVYKILNSFHDCGITVHAIAGNHDDVDSSQIPITSIHSFREIIHVIEKPEFFTIKDVEVVAIPYSKDKKFVLQSIHELREQCVDPDNSILLCHVGISGGKVGSGMYVMSDEYTLGELQYESFKYVVVGHYHQPQLLEYNSIYCGTPVQNNFGDELKGKDGYNGFFVIDTEKRYDIQFVPIIAPRFITVSSAEDLENYDSDELSTNYIRVKASADDVDEIKETLGEIMGEDNTQEVRLELEKTYEKDARSDVSVAMSFEDAVKTYATEQVDHENRENAIKVGLSILSEAMVGGE